VTGGVLKIARRICEVGVAGSPVIGRRRGAFSTLLQQSGLRASTGGVLTTKSERKMLASTCLYSLYPCMVAFNDYTSVQHEMEEQFGGRKVVQGKQQCLPTGTKQLAVDCPPCTLRRQRLMFYIMGGLQRHVTVERSCRLPRQSR